MKYANEADMLNIVLANLESYNAVLINWKKSQKERMEMLRELVVQQLTVMEQLNTSSLPDIK